MSSLADINLKLKHSEVLSKNEFAAILAKYNKDIGNEAFFRELIYDGFISGKLAIVPEQQDLGTAPEYRNYKFETVGLKAWAISKELNVTKEGELISKMKYEDLWGINDIAEILSINNRHSREFFIALIDKAMQSSDLVTTPNIWALSDYRDKGPQFKKDIVVSWIRNKGLKWPLELSPKSVEQIKDNPKALASFMKISITAAVKKYGFDPKASRSNIPKKIADDVKEITREAIDADTVRDQLKKAAEFFLHEEADAT